MIQDRVLKYTPWLDLSMKIVFHAQYQSYRGNYIVWNGPTNGKILPQSTYHTHIPHFPCKCFTYISTCLSMKQLANTKKSDITTCFWYHDVVLISWCGSDITMWFWYHNVVLLSWCGSDITICFWYHDVVMISWCGSDITMWFWYHDVVLIM